MKTAKPILLVLCSAILLSSLALLQLRNRFKDESLTRTFDESVLFATDVLIKELPIAESLEVKEKMEELLDYDKIYFNKYFFSSPCEIFVTYWSPGKTSLRGKYGHNPDNCWVSSGGVRTDYSSNYELCGLNQLNGDWRRFDMRGQDVEVIYWYFFGGQQISTETGTRAPNSFIGDIASYGLDQRKEHIYIRISTDGSFSDLMDDPEFCSFLTQLFQQINQA